MDQDNRQQVLSGSPGPEGNALLLCQPVGQGDMRIHVFGITYYENKQVVNSVGCDDKKK